MKIQKTLVLAIFAILTLALAACGGTQATPEAQAQVAAEPAAEEPMEDTSIEESEAEEPPAEEPAAAPEAGGYMIVSEESEARFLIGEVLAGNAITVVGVTNAVEGQIFVDYANPQVASMSAIQVDMSSLATDNNFRNNAIHGRILETGNPDFRYATFEVTSITGLPDSVTIGQPFEAQITGNLTIHGVTREETFTATITPVSETRIEGLASVTVLYSDFDVQILRLPDQVASVEDEVTLELEFIAEAQ
ncbi:MAG: YceI family protein [Anaerolineales bacterium]|nr:YceI family protein [Anaerolineales bacterium]